MDDVLASFTSYALGDIEQQRDSLRKFARALKRAGIVAGDETENLPPRLVIAVMDAAPPPPPLKGTEHDVRRSMRHDAQRLGYGFAHGDDAGPVHAPVNLAPPPPTPGAIRVAYVAGVLAARPYTREGGALAHSVHLKSRRFDAESGVEIDDFAEPIKQVIGIIAQIRGISPADVVDKNKHNDSNDKKKKKRRRDR